MIGIAVLPLLGVLIAPPVGSQAGAVTGPEDGCPSARQVTDAMAARFPEALALGDGTGWPRGAGTTAAKAEVLRAFLDVPPDGTVVRFWLVDGRGDVRLRRTLPAAGRGSQVAADCVALAETIAAIVERYLAVVAYEANEDVTAPPRAPEATLPLPPGPAPMATRAWQAFAGLAWRGGSDGHAGGEARLGAALDLTRSWARLGVLASVGLGTDVDAQWVDGAAVVRRIPMRIGTLLQVPLGRGALSTSLEAGPDLLLIASRPAPDAAVDRFIRLAAVAELAVGYRLDLARSFYIRPRAAAGVALVRYDVSLAGAPGTVFRTSGGYATLGVETGWVFR